MRCVKCSVSISVLLWAVVLAGVAGRAQTTARSATEADKAESSRMRRLIETGHAEEVLHQIEILRAQVPATKILSRTEGLADYTLGRLKQADEAFAEALKENPTDTEAAQMRGLTLFRLGRPAEAIPLLEPSRGSGVNMKADPNYVLGLCYMDTRRYDDARRAFAAQYGFAPESAPAYLVSARMLLRREYLPISQSFAEKALQLDPTLPLAHELLGEIALVGNHLDEAIAELEKERAHNPLEGLVYDRLGDAYVRAGKYDEAQHSLQEAVLLEPNATGPLILLGKTMLKKNDPLGASTFLERARAMDPANYMTHSLLGQAYRAMGRTDDASRENATAQTLQAASEPKLESLH